jgi:hypothetical protein
LSIDTWFYHDDPAFPDQYVADFDKIPLHGAAPAVRQDDSGDDADHEHEEEASLGFIEFFLARVDETADFFANAAEVALPATIRGSHKQGVSRHALNGLPKSMCH